MQQSYAGIEYIVIDGGSTDSSLQYVQEHSSKINYWVSEPDKGIYNAMNKGIIASSGEYLLFLNSGDVLYDKNTIETIIDSLSGSDLVIGKVMFDNTKQVNILPDDLTMLRFIEKSIPHPSTFIKRELMLRHMYDESLKIVSDWKFFMQVVVIDNATYRYLDEVIVLFETSGISSVNKTAVEIERKKVLDEMLPDRIRIDYMRFINGSGYSDDCYDRLFVKIKKSHVGRIVYTAVVLITKTLSLFKKSFTYAQDYPLTIKYDE
jgi:glycosyltransferase involved in cell wall biosynthesis